MSTGIRQIADTDNSSSADRSRCNRRSCDFLNCVHIHLLSFVMESTMATSEPLPS